MTTQDSPTSRALKAVFFGTPALATHALKSCIDAGIEIPLVCTRPPRPAGRGKAPRPSAIQVLANDLDIPVIAPDRLDDRAADAIAEARPDVAIVVAYGRLIPDAILSLPRRGAVNLHPSLLPRHRGPSPVQTAILAGDTHTGATIMLLDSGMDTGPILRQSEPMAVPDHIRADELSDLLFELGGEMMPDAIRQWCEGDIEPTPQDESLATQTRLLTKSDGLIDWQLDARRIIVANRAYHPWPGTHTTWDGINLKLIRCAANVVPTPSGHAQPGTVWGSDDVAHITAGDGKAIVPTELQLAGRKATSVAEFLRGRPDFIGATLGT